MAPPPPTGGTFLPRSFTCRVCGKDKKPEAYSKSQIQKWFTKKKNDRDNSVTPHNIGLTCKDHASDQREVRCHGPCDLIKIVDRFSKNQRNKPAPWCIACTEWKATFNGNELPTAPPNHRLAAHEENDDVDDDDDDVEDVFRIRSPKPSFNNDDEDEDAESSDDDDQDSSPYGEPTLVTSAVDRLQGYGSAYTDEGTTTDGASTTDTMGISGWGGQHVNAGRGFGNSARTVTSGQVSTTQSRGAAVSSNSARNTSNFQGYASAGSGAATPAGVTAQFNRIALGPAGNQQSRITHSRTNAQAGHHGNSEQGASTLPSRISAGRPVPDQMKGDVRGGSFAPAQQAPNVKNRGSRKENSAKWYKGDNRKVFPGKRRDAGHAVPDGREEAHDSDSPDEM
ncbi:hypothetical protein F5Y01DRAFT_311867 [Xylaria sp. FL0043]|nr:hypothetical protein F5Y01DRAFT_311867 [Xylaria sp. FL0043]